jgi:DNA-directed RNA polymerase specialized sigma24 family protein
VNHGDSESSFYLEMTKVPDDPHDEEQRLEALYRDHFDALMDIALSELKCSVSEAEKMVDDVFLASLRHIRTTPDPHQWLVGVMTEAVQHAAKGQR